MFIDEATLKDHDFFTAEVHISLEHFALGPGYKGGVFALEIVQWTDSEITDTWPPVLLLWPDDHLLVISRLELVEFHEQRAALLGEWSMR